MSEPSPFRRELKMTLIHEKQVIFNEFDPATDEQPARTVVALRTEGDTLYAEMSDGTEKVVPPNGGIDRATRLA